MIATNIRSSLVKFAQMQISWALANSVSADVQFIDLDAHAVTHEWPSRDLLGTAGVAMEAGDKIHEITAAFAVATFNDINLFRHYQLMDRLYQQLQPESRIPIYDAVTGSVLSWAVVKNGSSIMPMGRSETRPIQFCAFNALVDPLLA